MYPITIFHSKSVLAKKFQISRKTIQRKVRSGELSQDSKGRVRDDELFAILKVDAMRGRRGPKIRFKPEEISKTISNFKGERLGSEFIEPDEISKANATLDQGAVEEIKSQLVGLNSATLNKIAILAVTYSEHKRRLANVGLSLEPSLILEALESPGG